MSLKAMQQSDTRPAAGARVGARPRALTTVLAPADITHSTWDELWRLTETYFDTERSYVEAELRRHQRIALFRSTIDGALVGMASIDIVPTRFRQRRVLAIVTSHVLLREAYRGHNLIQRLGARMYASARARYPLHAIHWFFDTFSYKSYLLMPRNFSVFWPRHDRETPEYEAALINHLAIQIYGPAWRPARGIKVRSGQKRLRPGTAPLPSAAVDMDPNLDFFAHANPGHAEGDTLVCLCPLTMMNWAALIGRAYARWRRRSHDL